LHRALTAAAALLLLGVLRELFARGTLFATAREYFGSDLPLPALRWSEPQHGLLLFAQPAGALFALAGLMAALQAWRSRTPSTSDHA
jgi:Na+-translocating ferredoxin:NAD+ oxidoreductase RnfE subunit